MTTIHEALKDVGMEITYRIAVRSGGCFQLVPVFGGTRPREYYKPTEIDGDYRRFVKKYGSDNVKVFREIQVVFQQEDD